MTAGPKQHFGLHDFHQGELRNARVHIYPTLADLNAAAPSAQARVVYVIETQRMYWGGPGAWSALPLDATLPPGGGTPVDVVTDPNDLDYIRAAVSGTVASSDDVADTITVNFTPGELDHVQVGDELVVTGSADNAATPWLDGTYEILSIDTGTGEVTFATGAIPAVPALPVSSYGNYQLNDLTGPADGFIAVVNPDPDTDITLALYIYDGGTDTWGRHNDYDLRLIFADASRAFSVIPVVESDLTDIPSAIENLITNAYLIGQLSGYTTGPHYIEDIDSAGTNTVVTINTTDETEVNASVGETLRVAGTSTALDGDNTILVANWAAGVATIEVANVAVTDASPTGTAAVYDTDQELATIEDVNAVGGDLAAHIAAGDPHPQYQQSGEVDTQIDSKISTHAAAADPHSAYLTSPQIDSKVDLHNNSPTAHPNAFLAHNDDATAHNGALAAILTGASTRPVHDLQAVDPALQVGQPAVPDPHTLMYREWAAGETPSGLVQSVSTEDEILGDVSVTFAAGQVSMSTEAASRFSSNDVLRFPGAATNTSYFRIRSVDEGAGILYLWGTVAAEGPITSAINVVSKDATIVQLGLLNLASGRTLSSTIDIVTINTDPAMTQIVLDVGESIDQVPVGAEVALSGTTDNDGTYIVSAVDGSSRTVALTPQDLTVNTTSNLIASTTVATNTITVNAGADLTDVLPGDRVTLAGTTDNDGIYTADTVDDGAKTIVTVEDLVGTDGGAAGTFTVVRENGASALPGTDFPPYVDPIVSGLVISSITDDIGGGLGRIFFSGAPDLSSVQAGNDLTISGSDSDDGDYIVDSVDDGADHITVTATLIGQVGAGGTVDVAGIPAGTAATDGTAAFAYVDDSANNDFDTAMSGAQGKTFFADAAATYKYSENPGLYELGVQLTPELLFVNISLHLLSQQYFTGGEVLAAGDICYLNSDGEYYQTDASAEAASRGRLAIAAEVGADATVSLFLTPGATWADGGLTTGEPVYLDPTTAGGYTQTVPASSGDIVRIIGYGDENGDLFFDPDGTWVEVA